MPNPSPLFKAPEVTVHQAPEWRDGKASPVKAMMQTGNHTILLDADATELLLSYLHVIRGYFSCFRDKRKITARFYRRVAEQLAQSLAVSGQEVAQNEDVSRLIHTLGCTTDWNHQFGQPSLEEKTNSSG